MDIVLLQIARSNLRQIMLPRLLVFVALLGGIRAHASGERIRVPLGRRLADVVADDRRPHRLARRFELEADDDSPNGTKLVVEEVKAAVTSQTTYSFHKSRAFDEDRVKDISILASNPKEVEGLTIMSINKSTGDVRGLRRGRVGDAHVISSDRSDGHRKLRLRRTEGDMPAKNWSCGAAHAHDDDDDDDDDHFHTHTRSGESNLFGNGEANPVSTERSSISTGDTPASTVGVPGAWVVPSKYSFHVDISIDIDKHFIERQGSAEAAVEYINVLLSAANVVFEHEVDAHLNIVHIEETDIYDSLTTTRDALRTMRMTPRPNAIDGCSKIILHHAMLGRYLGGGIAFIDSICDDKWAYGVTSDLSGSVAEMGDITLFDFFIVTHEIGHSLGSGHTFDAYDPPVDACGACTIKSEAEGETRNKVVIDGLPEDNSATLMSYCNFCEGGMRNIAITMGGLWDGIQPRADMGHWSNHPDLVGSVSVEPKRVSYNVWDRLASKGQCVSPPSDTNAVQGCNDDSDCDDNNLCTIDYCDPSGLCAISETLEYCCGNGKCEHGEGQRCAPDCGPFKIKAPEFCEECHTIDGFMVDVALSEESERRIFVSSINLMYASPINDDDDQATIDVYVTTGGSYVGKEQSADSWMRVASVTFSRYNPKKGPQFIEVELHHTIPVDIGSRRGFYFQSTERNIMFGEGAYSTRNEDEVELHSSRAVSGLFGDGIDGFALSFEVGYLLDDRPPPTASTAAAQPLPASLQSSTPPPPPPSVGPSTSRKSPLTGTTIPPPILPQNLPDKDGATTGEYYTTQGDIDGHSPASDEIQVERPAFVPSDEIELEYIAEAAGQPSPSTRQAMHAISFFLSWLVIFNITII